MGAASVLITTTEGAHHGQETQASEEDSPPPAAAPPVRPEKRPVQETQVMHRAKLHAFSSDTGRRSAPCPMRLALIALAVAALCAGCAGLQVDWQAQAVYTSTPDAPPILGRAGPVAGPLLTTGPAPPVPAKP